ncbi:MAG: zinc metalloprotease HtpX [Candidatus Woykebacteria bacterium GWB1_45_5]|uniref:Protease HtpX homolog n=2 Tax=Candidatus Woykeibacteriota TaxID=1817899 RepID=A0A1G1VZY8_9BACT|nr:MAG: zinc metalloprotease HtpX [Candidatus Woykebacteria bacterium GWA1_44_8]OGY23566.1 MAG: zinc metalloprotease HtpX [Candidatus Woykebacteria bacterium GWB1_45_5]
MVPTIYNQIDANRRKTFLLMIGFSLFIVLAVYILTRALGYESVGALSFAGLFLVISGLINLSSYYWSDKLVIALSGAQLLEKKDKPELYRAVENVCIAAGIPLPKIYIITDPAPNAFATGRDPNHAAVAVTSGLLERLDDLELEGVVAHELSHIKNYDSRLMSIVVILVGMIVILADMFFRMLWWGKVGDGDRKGSNTIFLLLGVIAAILAPIAANLIKLAISRRREFLADASGALLTRYPEGLAKALIKISQDPNTLKSATNATAHMYIANPFKGKQAKNWLVALFSTHPSVEERVAALRAMTTS